MRSIRRFPAGRAAVLAILAASTTIGQQSQFQGSVPTGTVSPAPLALTLHDAIDQGQRALIAPMHVLDEKMHLCAADTGTDRLHH